MSKTLTLTLTLPDDGVVEDVVEDMEVDVQLDGIPYETAAALILAVGEGMVMGRAYEMALEAGEPEPSGVAVTAGRLSTIDTIMHLPMTVGRILLDLQPRE